jgi:hypothetical protein
LKFLHARYNSLQKWGKVMLPCFLGIEFICPLIVFFSKLLVFRPYLLA